MIIFFFFLISPQCTTQGGHKIIEMNAFEQLNAKGGKTPTNKQKTKKV